MKKIFFSLSIILAFFNPTSSFAVVDMPANVFEIVQHQSRFFSHYLQIENPCFDDYIFDMDDDDMKDSERDNFSFGKNAFKINSFVSNNFSDKFFKRICFTRCSINFSQPGFISLRVLRL